MIVMAAYFGFVIATLTTGFLAELGGKKSIMIISATLFLAGIYSFSKAAAFPVLFASFFCIGLGCGAAELGSNKIIVDVQEKNQGFYFNLMSVLYGLGSMPGQTH